MFLKTRTTCIHFVCYEYPSENNTGTAEKVKQTRGATNTNFRAILIAKMILKNLNKNSVKSEFKTMILQA